MKTDDKVRFKRADVTGTGIILGLAQDHLLRYWIVKLDEPINFDNQLYKAIVFPESELTKIE